MSSAEYLLDGIDFSNIAIMDAGTGAGSTTLLLARRLAEAGCKSRIVSVDIDPTTFPYVKEKLGELARLVEFLEADLRCMPQVGDESFDLVACTGTLCALNNRPLRVLRGLTELYRVLKNGARLVVSEEYPLPRATKAEEEVQVLHWQTYKAVAELVDGEHWTEIYPEELEHAVSLVGFGSIEWRRFEGGPLREATMREWEEVMLRMAGGIENARIREAFLASIRETSKRFEEQGGVCPPSYVMKMRKPQRNGSYPDH